MKFKVKFNEAHCVPHGYYEYANSLVNPYKRIKVFNQLIVCISGSHEYILEKLKKIVSEMESEGGKPVQGQIVTDTGNTIEVITPVWNNEVFKTIAELSGEIENKSVAPAIIPPQEVVVTIDIAEVIENPPYPSIDNEYY